jgi:acetyltransferase EpsM
MKRRILIAGAGGHARVVAETVGLLGTWEIMGFLDDRVPVGTVVFQDREVVAPLEQALDVAGPDDAFVVALGDNQARRRIFERLAAGRSAATIVHPFSFVSPGSRLGEGTVVLAGAVVSRDCVVGRNCIVNARVLVDHDSAIGDHCHLAQGAVIGSNVLLSQGTATALGELIPSFSRR